MQREKITMEVPAATARAYQRASASTRRRAESAVALALQSPGQAADELDQLLGRMNATAAERGMTDERLRELLDDGGRTAVDE